MSLPAQSITAYAVNYLVINTSENYFALRKDFTNITQKISSLTNYLNNSGKSPIFTDRLY